MLELDRLHALARQIAAEQATWERHVAHDPDERTFHLLHEDDDISVWLLCWSPGHDTGFHDHGGSRGAVTVVEGAVREDRLGPGGRPQGREVGVGGSFDVEPSDIHRVRHAGHGPAVTIHVYSPPLREMGAYDVDDGELRPLEVAPAV